MSTSAEEFKPQLKDGLVGSQIVKYFLELDGRLAVDAKSLRGGVQIDSHNYEITFESGEVQAYRVEFVPRTQFTVANVVPLD